MLQDLIYCIKPEPSPLTVLKEVDGSDLPTSETADTWRFTHDGWHVMWAPSYCAFPSDYRQDWRLLCGGQASEKQDKGNAGQQTRSIYKPCDCTSLLAGHCVTASAWTTCFSPRNIVFFFFFINCNFLAGRGRHAMAHRCRPEDSLHASMFSFYRMDPGDWTQVVSLGDTPLVLTNPSCWPLWSLYF